MSNIIKIATLLPYKENYTFSKAQAAAIWVSDFFKHSKFKKNNFIFGNTKGKDFLTSNYINIPLKSLGSKFLSTTYEYCNEFIKINNKNNFDIVEIHNRPLVLTYLQKKISTKFIIYFHNDPLSMKGSITTKERINLLNICDKIVFITEWVKKRFFKNLSGYSDDNTNVIYHSVYKQKKISKKRKYITFVGKLNEAKGYDIFGDAIIKILNKHKDWKAFSIGDEKRERPIIKHKQHTELGFLNHKKVLDFLNKSEIAVVPSRWEEPFGRTALEASSKGCATIISNRGGLPETTDHSIILKSNTAKELYKEISRLILNNRYRAKVQLQSFKNVKHLIEDNTILIDSLRSELINIFNLNFNKNKLRIINIYNTGQKTNHRLYNISLGKKFTNGFIRNGHDVIEISDRDFLRQNRLTSIKNNQTKLQEFFINTSKNYNPDLIFFGHTNNVEINTLESLREFNKSLIISQWNEDPFMPSLQYSNYNIENLSKYYKFVDHNFVTTHPSILKKQKLNTDNFHFFFVPVDPNIECFEVYKLNPKKDLFYAMSHGVNRGSLKKGKKDQRMIFLNSLIKKLSNIKYDFYGFNNKEPIWGNEFYKTLINSKMGLNLSRGKATKYYSSNRIASLMGNGLMTFIDKKTQLNDFFKNDELIFYNDINDLVDKLIFYKKNDKLRKKIAHKGRKKYFRLFDEKKTSKYIIDTSLGKKVNFY